MKRKVRLGLGFFTDVERARDAITELGDTRLRTAGPARAVRFTWERTAREVDALLHDGRGPT